MALTLIDVAQALWLIFPAYCANAIPVIFGGGPPLDAGRTFVDGKPILGSHKTFRGFFSGLVVGTLVGCFQTLLFQNIVFQYGTQFRYDVLLGFLVSLGALVGDIIESFVKRRLDRPPGSSLPLADQLDFVVGALIFSVPASPPLSLATLLIIVIITPPIHISTNLAVNWVKKKRREASNGAVY